MDVVFFTQNPQKSQNLLGCRLFHAESAEIAELIRMYLFHAESAEIAEFIRRKICVASRFI